MNKNFNFSVWIFSSIAAGFFLAGGMALVEGANLWPLTAIMGGIIGLIIGVIFGVIFKLLSLPMKYAWMTLGMFVFLTICGRIYIKYYHTYSHGKLIEAKIVECAPSNYFFTLPYRNINERKKVNGIDLTLKVMRERKLEKFEDRRIKMYSWNKVDYTKTYFKEQISCANMIAGKTIVLRAKDYGLNYDYVHENRWDLETIFREGNFIIHE
jgi:ABC-type antimicrobial peptide transport system permease subunit